MIIQYINHKDNKLKKLSPPLKKKKKWFHSKAFTWIQVANKKAACLYWTMDQYTTPLFFLFLEPYRVSYATSSRET